MPRDGRASARGKARRARLIGFAALVACLAPAAARAELPGGLPADPSSLSNFSSLLEGGVVAELVKTVGALADHRPYEPATGLGVVGGLDIGVAVTLMKMPESLISTLASAGLISADTQPIPLPMVKVHLHKGISKSIDGGISAIQYASYKIYGADLKFVISQPEEGPTWALRLSYSYAALAYIYTQTVTPTLLVSRKVVFADPYLGLGVRHSFGNVKFDTNVDVQGISVPISYTSARAQATSGLALLGVALKVPGTALKLVLGGEYSTAGMQAIGFKGGLSF